MKLFPYWQSLETGRRILSIFLAAIVMAVIGVGAYGYFKGEQLVFPLEKQADLFPAEAHLFPATSLLTPMRVEVNAYLVSEQYSIGAMQLPLWATWVYLAGLGVALAFFWTIASSLKRIPYFVAVSLGMLWLSTFNLDLLGIFPETSRTLLLIALGTLGISSYLFQAFLPQVSFSLRCLFFSMLVLLLGSALFYASPLPAVLTALHVVNYSTASSVVASVLFMVLVAYENLHGLLWFNTQAQQPERRFGLPQFLVISVLYLGNLLLLYLRQTGVLDIDFTGLDALVIFLISAVVGLWGLRQRQVQYARFLQFETEAAPLYLVLALLTFLNLGYAFLMANDPMVQAYRGTIVFTHLAYGIAFWLYLLVNFWPLMKQKLRVYRVVYDPKRLPYFIVYLTGTVILVVLAIRGNYAVYYQSKAGYYNYLGDVYRQTEESPLLAEQFYNEGSILARTNQRSAYSLVDMYHQAGMRTLEINRLEDILARKPSPEGYLRLANLYTSPSDLFDHLGILQKGTKHYPAYAPLLNNLALLYGTTTFKDSAAFYLDAALEHSSEPEVIQANQLSFLYRHQFLKQAKEFSERYQNGTYAPLQTNRLAIAFLTGEKIPQNLSPLPQDSALTTQTFATFYLRQLLPASVKESTAALDKVNQLLRQDKNQAFLDDLTLLKAILQQRAGQTAQAKTTLLQLAASSEGTAGHYYDILGQWMLQASLYPLAADYFQKARTAGYRDGHLHEMVALALAGQHDQAAQLVLQGSSFPEPWQQRTATHLAIVTQLTAAQAVAAPDSLKVRFLELRASNLPIAELEAVAEQITTPALAPTAALPLIARYLRENKLITAHNLLQTHFPASFPKNSLKSKANVLQAELWRKAEQWQDLEKQLPTLYFTSQDQGTVLYYKALLAQRNKQPKEATHLFERLSQQAPWFEIGQLAAANFFVSQKQALKAYNLLLEAIAFNPTSVAMRKAYVRLALEQGLKDYALQGLEQLAPLVSPAEYLTFKREINAKLQASEALQQEWQ